MIGRIDMASELGFEEKVFGEKCYECDPHKNYLCRKSGCEFNIDIPMFARNCSHTLHKEYEWDGKSKRYDSYGCPEWLKGE
jgi:hypothetical protein